ncbi:MAG TPA: hypothetical protein VGM58_09415 [Verrucomicrobiae bacterium]|jgi:hypothetical protein
MTNTNDKLKITFVYLHISGREDFLGHSKKFVDTYLKYPAGVEHDLIIGVCGVPLDKKAAEIFAPLKCTFIRLENAAWDISAHQQIAHIIDSDFMVCCTSRTYFWKAGWLKRFVEARKQFGEGLYGSAGSFEFNPHIRTCFFGFNPMRLREYPYVIDTRKKAHFFECRKWNFTKRFGRAAFMVTWDGVYQQANWRTPPNIFRRGDQTNLLTWDKHSRIYADAKPSKKKILERDADGFYNGLMGKARKVIDLIRA